MYTIKKDSLMSHFLFQYCGVSHYNMRWDNPIPDVCTLIKTLFFGLMRVLLIIAVAIFSSFGLLGWIVPLLAMGWNGALHEEFFRASFIIFCFMSLFVVLMFVAYLLVDAYGKVKERFRKGYDEVKEPTLFGAWYEGVKNKYCIRVKYEGYENEE